MSLFLSRRARRLAFTLQEVAVVLVTIAILAVIAIPTYRTFIEGTKKGTAEASAQAYVQQARVLAALEEDSQPGSTLQTLPEVWVEAGKDMTDGSYIEGVPTPLPADATPTDLNGTDPGSPSFDLVAGDLAGPIDFGYGIDDNYYPVTLTVVGDEVTIVGEDGEESPPPLAVAPGAPTSVTGARATATSATVSFTAPASDGGAAITSYTAACTSSDEGDPGTSAGAASPLTVSGLTEGKTYTCSVTATNSAGTSPASSASAAFTLIVVPDAPANLAAEPTAAGDDRLVFTWNPVASTTAKPVTGYALYQLNPVTDLYEVAALIPGQESDTYTLTGLTTGTTYSFVIASTNAAGEGTRSSAITATPIGVPDAATITGTGLGNETISIDWMATSTAAGPITGFRLYLDGVEVDAVGGAIRTYTYTGLTAGTEYDLEVRSYNTMGETAAAAATDEVTETAITAIDQVAWANPAATVTDTSVTLSWTPLTSTAAKPVTGYALYRLNAATGIYDLVSLIPGDSSDSYEVTGLTAGVEYSFQIAGYNTLGEGERSATTTATPITTPAAATITETTLGDGTATITWEATSTDAAPITGFTLYKNGVEVTTVGDEVRTYTFTGLTAGVEYDFEVRAFNSTGETAAAASTDEVTETAISIVDQVTWANPATSVTATSVTLNWNAMTSTSAKPVTGYTVYQLNTGTGLYDLVSLVPGASSDSYEVTGLTAGTTYSFKVAAYNSLGEGLRSAAQTATPITVPTAPLSVTATAGSGQASVSWTAPSSNGGSAVTGYTVSYGTSSTGPWTQAATGVAATNYTVTGLTNGTDYWFHVIATNTAGAGPGGVSVSKTTPFAPLNISYSSTALTFGSNQQALAPTVTGGLTGKEYMYYGSLPTGVTFNWGNGTISGPASSAWNFQVTQIASSGKHTCALTTAGGVKCWGSNDMGQLGNGTTTSIGTPNPTPVDVLGLTSGVAHISVGDGHTCAVTTSGGVKCWGLNANGQLGDGSTTARNAPVDVSGLTSGGAQVSAGLRHTCVVTTSGGAKCWGQGNAGQLGDGTSTNRTTPVNVSGLTSGVARISTGYQHTCAVTTSGGAKCWGLNFNGQLGDSSTTTRTTPVNVSGMTAGVARVSAGASHTCAVTTSGGVKCWGLNTNGQLGDGSNTQRTTPVDVSGLTSGVARISAGASHTCAVTTSGGVKCWGLNTNGLLGDGTSTNRTTPVNVSGLTSGVSDIAYGANPSCAVTTTGGAKCWGLNTFGQLGDGSTTASTTPVNVLKTGPQPGFPAMLVVKVTDWSGSAQVTITLTLN